MGTLSYVVLQEQRRWQRSLSRYSLSLASVHTQAPSRILLYTPKYPLSQICNNKTTSPPEPTQSPNDTLSALTPNHIPTPQQPFHIRSLHLPITLLLFLHQYRQYLNRRPQSQSVSALPALQPREADAGAILRGEVKVAENFLLDGEGLLVDCREG